MVFCSNSNRFCMGWPVPDKQEDMPFLNVAVAVHDENLDLLQTDDSDCVPSAWESPVSQPMVRQLGSCVQRPRARAMACAGLLSAGAAVACAAFSLQRTPSTLGYSNPETVIFAEVKGKQLWNAHNGRCIDWSDSAIIKTPTCNAISDKQRWEYNIDDFNHIKTITGNKCMDAGGDFVHYWDCLPETSEWAKNQRWVYDPNLQHIKTQDGKYCLESNDDGGAIGKKPCEIDTQRQKWTLQYDDLPTPPPTQAPVVSVVTESPSTSSIVTPAPATWATPAPVVTPAPATWATPAPVVTPAPATWATPAPVVTPAPATWATPAPVVTPAPATWATPAPVVTPAPATWATPAPTTPMSVAPTTPKPAVAQTTIPVTQPVTPKIEVPETQHAGVHVVKVPMHITHQGRNKYCMDGGGDLVHMFECSSANSAQHWLAVTGDDGEATGQLRNGQDLSEPGLCLANVNDQLKLEACSPQVELGEHSPQKWEFKKDAGQLSSYDETRCLDAAPGEQDALILLQDCNQGSQGQKWDEKALVDEKEGLPEAYLILILTIPALVIIAFVAAVLFFRSRGNKRAVKLVDHNKKAGLVAVRPHLPDAKMGVFKFADPRPDSYPRRDADIVAFSFPGFEEPWDKRCSASFLANSYDVGSDCLQLKATGETKQFCNAEAAFHALTFQKEAEEFGNLSSEGELKKKYELRGHEDWDCAGCEHKWKAMMAVLRAKFKSGSELEKALEKTGDAFLLNHSGRLGEDPVWSDNNDGEGTNWLGLQLMLLRDRCTGWKRWTNFIESSIDRQTGERIQAEDNNPDAWQDAVRSARAAVVEEMVKQGRKNGFHKEDNIREKFPGGDSFR